MANKNENGDHVSLARAEYEAFLAREESFQKLLGEHEQTRSVNRSLADSHSAQSRNLALSSQRIEHLERQALLLRTFVDMLRAETSVAAMADLSEFWRQWQINTSKTLDARKTTTAEIAKYEPELFKSWRNWVNDAGKQDRTLNEAGTRVVDEKVPVSPREMQEHTIVRLRQENAALANRLLKLEAEIESHKQQGKHA